MTKHTVCTNESITTIAKFIATQADFGIVYEKRWDGSERMPSIGGA